MRFPLTVCLYSEIIDFGRRLEPLAASIGVGVELNATWEAWLACLKDMKVGCAVAATETVDEAAFEAIGQSQQLAAGVPLVAVVGEDRLEVGARLGRLGARHVMTLTAPDAQLHDAVKECALFSYMIRQERDALVEAQRRLALISPKDQEVLELLMKGYTNVEIGAKLKRSDRTIENRRRAINLALGVQSVPELVKMVLWVRWSPYRDWSRPMTGPDIVTLG